MTQSEVTALLGLPTSRSTTSEGEEVWLFRRASDDGGLRQSYVAVATMGLNSGANAVKVDVLTIEFEDGLVSSYRYDQNLDNSLLNAGQNQ